MRRNHAVARIAIALALAALLGASHPRPAGDLGEAIYFDLLPEHMLKVDPLLNMQLAHEAAALRSGGARRLPVVAASDPDDVALFVRTTDPELTNAAIERLGGTVTVETGAILVAHVQLDDVEELALRDEVEHIAASRRVEPLLDASRVELKVDKVNAGSSLPRAFTGRGVVVGVVDSGIDLTHPAFKHPSGSTRVLRLWDQTTGERCTNTTIDLGACRSADTNGHGTHVAGIAAGKPSNSPFIGVAPEAELMVVHTNLSDTGIAEGVDYIFREAAAMGRSAVVNLSLGGHDTAHDGRSNGEAVLEGLVGPGKIIVAAAGNEGALPIHVRLRSGGSGLFRGGLAGGDVDEAVLYSDSANVRLTLRVWQETSQGLNFLGATDPLPVTGNLAASLSTTGGNVAFELTGGREPSGSQTLSKYLLRVGSADTRRFPLRSFLWELAVTGGGTADAWALSEGLFITGGISGITFGDTSYTVGAPATGRRVISVASYVTKNSWTDASGKSQPVPALADVRPAIGAIAASSSRGPSRDGRRLPSVAAPGEYIAAPLSVRAAAAEIPAGFRLPQNGYTMLSGTSMASPNVAGVVALMLEAKKTLTPEEALAILQETARPSPTPDNTFGAGKVDALKAVSRVASAAGTPSGLAVTGITPRSGPVMGGTRVTISGRGFGSKARVRVGTVSVTPLNPTSTTMVIDMPSSRTTGTVPITVANADGQTASSSLFSYTANPRITSISPNPVSKGSTLTIGGTGLGIFNGVEFVVLTTNGRGTVRVSASDTSIRVLVPSNARSGRITLKSSASPQVALPSPQSLTVR